MANGFIKVVEGRYSGEVRTMRMAFNFYLQEIDVRTRRSDDSPSHKVIAKAPAGHWCDVGVAWCRKINNGPSSGKIMFSLCLNDPDFGDDPVYLNAFPVGNDWEIVVERKRTRTTAAQQEGSPEGEKVAEAA